MWTAAPASTRLHAFALPCRVYPEASVPVRSQLKHAICGRFGGPKNLISAICGRSNWIQGC
nr:MAG TPA: hypothetical protein [Bacteriophage sp.]DAR18280.1 MAG TPA: hypothetical protein [Bacteriophage sp.]